MHLFPESKDQYTQVLKNHWSTGMEGASKIFRELGGPSHRDSKSLRIDVTKQYFRSPPHWRNASPNSQSPPGCSCDRQQRSGDSRSNQRSERSGPVPGPASVYQGTLESFTRGPERKYAGLQVIARSWLK